jgi:hypothetical protein
MSDHLGLEQYMFSPADREILEDAGFDLGKGFGEGGWGDGESWGDGEGDGEGLFSPYCSAIEMRLQAGDRVISRVSPYSSSYNGRMFTLRVVGPVCDTLCENDECDDFSFLDRELFSRNEDEDDDDDRSSGSGTVVIVVITLLCAAFVVMCIWQYTRSREPAMVQRVELTNSMAAAAPRRRRRGERKLVRRVNPRRSSVGEPEGMEMRQPPA